jgi:hypothetical protein
MGKTLANFFWEGAVARGCQKAQLANVLSRLHRRDGRPLAEGDQTRHRVLLGNP